MCMCMCRPNSSICCHFIGLHPHRVFHSSGCSTSLPTLDNFSHSGELSYYDFIVTSVFLMTTDLNTFYDFVIVYDFVYDFMSYSI